MAQRVIDWPRIKGEPWTQFQRSVFMELLGEADSLGMQPENPAAVALALSEGEPEPVPVERVQAAMDFFCECPHDPGRPVLVRYEVGGRRYLCFRQWQKHQRIRYAVKPICPIPPEATRLLLGESTTELLGRNYQETTKKLGSSSCESPEELPRNSVAPPVNHRATVSVSVPVTVPVGTTHKASSREGAAKRPAARRRRKGSIELTPEQVELQRVGVGHFWKRLREWTNTPRPQWTSRGDDDAGVAYRFFAEKVTQTEMEFTPTDFMGLIDLFFDERIHPKSAANFDLFVKNWNALLAEWAKPEVRSRVEWRRRRRENAEAAEARGADTPARASGRSTPPGSGGDRGEPRQADGAGASEGGDTEAGGAQGVPGSPEEAAVPSMRGADAPGDEGLSEGAVPVSAIPVGDANNPSAQGGAL